MGFTGLTQHGAFGRTITTLCLESSKLASDPAFFFRHLGSVI